MITNVCQPFPLRAGYFAFRIKGKWRTTMVLVPLDKCKTSMVASVCIAGTRPV